MCFGSIMRSVHASVMPMKLSWSVKIQKVHSWTDQREELSALSDTCEPDDGAGLKVLSHHPPLLLAACLFTALQQNNTKMSFAFYIIQFCFGFFFWFLWLKTTLGKQELLYLTNYHTPDNNGLPWAFSSCSTWTFLKGLETCLESNVRKHDVNMNLIICLIHLWDC